jgi:hypothetical protein
MKQIVSYIGMFAKEVDKGVLALVAGLTALMIFINYQYRIDDWIDSHYTFSFGFSARYCVFLLAFGLPWLFYRFLKDRKYTAQPRFILLLLIAPAIFSLKMALRTPIEFTSDYAWNNYWNMVFYWPLRLVIMIGILYIIWRMFDRDQPFYGITTPTVKWKPYILMLLVMVPLVAAASTQPDFLAMYPKMKIITGVYNDAGITWWHKLIFELSYGSDFIGIELFFRGFLVLAFIKWAGKDAILPMACFYCTIHFGKPLGECISSFFGGIVLGVISYHTRSVLGGLMVHLGIAWMMEIGGYIGNALQK